MPPPPPADPPALGRKDAVDRVMARVEGPDLNATLRPGAPPTRVPPRPPAGGTGSHPAVPAPPPRLPPAAGDDPNATVMYGGAAARPQPGADDTQAAQTNPRIPRPTRSPATGSTLDVLLNEIRSLRRTQEEILELLQGRGVAGSRPAAAERSGAARAPARRTRGRFVLLVDDDAETAAASAAAMEAGSIEVRTVADGNRCLAAIGERRPDVLVLEVGIGGSMPGRDVINMIKATMEWVDIPIVLYTREAIDEDADAMRDYSADAIIRKAPGAELELAQRVGALLASA